MGEIEYRELIATDAAAVRDLRLAVIATDPEAFTISLEQEQRGSVEVLKTVLESFELADDRMVLGAFTPGLVGMVGVQSDLDRSRCGSARIWGMNVLPEYRRNGIATALVNRVVQFTRSVDGVDRIELEVAAEARSARLLYRKMGFVELRTKTESGKGERLLRESLGMELFLN